MATVRCADCGFLSHRNTETGHLDEVDDDGRKAGNPALSNPAYPIALNVLCFVRAHDLQADYRLRQTAGKTTTETTFQVIDLARDCAKFTEWHQGFTPKEHKEMIFEVEAAKLEQQHKENERLWHERQEASQRQWQEACEARNRRFQLLSGSIIAIVSAVLGGLITWLASK